MKTILNQFPRPSSPNICTLTDLYLNSSVNSSGSYLSHCFSSIPNLHIFSRDWTRLSSNFTKLLMQSRGNKNNYTMLYLHIKNYNKQNPPKRFVCENKECWKVLTQVNTFTKYLIMSSWPLLEALSICRMKPWNITKPRATHNLVKYNEYFPSIFSILITATTGNSSWELQCYQQLKRI